jgi:hypothetical protein
MQKRQSQTPFAASGLDRAFWISQQNQRFDANPHPYFIKKRVLNSL